MRINGLTVCVDYSHELARNLHRWQRGLHSLLVVTTPQDEETKQICNMFDVPYCETDAFYRNGAAFNKGLAMEEARQTMNWQDWILFFDADITPEQHWLRTLYEADPTRINGAPRFQAPYTTGDSPIQEVSGCGYFQLFHSQDPIVQRWPLLDGSWRHAGGYDCSFRKLWPGPAKEMPIFLIHNGPPATNWHGVNRRDEQKRLFQQRNLRGGSLPEERLR